MYDKEGKTVNIGLSALIRANGKYLKKKVFKPYLKMLCMRLILFYQRRISKHTCLYHGAIVGILLGAWRILRCNPFSKGGYDPAPEKYFKKRWLL